MNLDPTVNRHFYSKKNRNMIRKQERFEKSKKYPKECENSLKLQEEYLKGLK